MSINKLLWTAGLVVLLAACSTERTNEWFVTHNGNMPTPERISQVKVGSSREEVRQILGAPSTVVSFDKNTWIYMSSDIKRVAFFTPEEISRDVLTIRFNDKDEVAEITRLSKADGEKVRVSADETEAYGQEPGFFQKYFGGVGQYNPFMNNNSTGL